MYWEYTPVFVSNRCAHTVRVSYEMMRILMVQLYGPPNPPLTQREMFNALCQLNAAQLCVFSSALSNEKEEMGRRSGGEGETYDANEDTSFSIETHVPARYSKRCAKTTATIALHWQIIICISIMRMCPVRPGTGRLHYVRVL